MLRKILIIFVFGLLLAFSSMDGSAASAVQDLPNYAFVEGLVGHGQTYPLSCESRSAADLAQYWGVDVSEVTFFDNLPVSDNPEKGFVGSVFGTWGQTPPNPYGVHAKPVAKLLRQYGLDATARRGMTVADLKIEIANGRPVIVWVVGRVWEGTPIEYTAKNGKTVIVAQYEHTMIAYGYDLSGIYLMDAGSGARQAYAYSIFKASWSVLGNMAVTAVGARQVGTQNPAPGGGQQQYVVQPGDYLTMLANRWGISWQDLAALNGITYPYIITPGQVLLTGLPAQETESTDPAPTATPKPTSDPGDAPEPTALPTATAPPKPKPTQTPTPTAPSETGNPNKTLVYTVQSGDHLMKIARELGLDWQEIAALNQLAWPYILYPGQQLELPVAGLIDTPVVSTPEPPPSGGQSSGSGEGADPKTYTVLAGEHLMQIARKLELSWTAIAQINQLQPPYVLYPGQVLVLPGPDAGPPPPPLVDQEDSVSPSSGETYIVQKGEYLYGLAQRFGVNWQVLASYNKISYPFQIYPGQVLKIP